MRGPTPTHGPRRAARATGQAAAAWALLALLLLGEAPRGGSGSEAAAGAYTSRFNKTCKYAAFNISASLFTEGVDGGYAFLMPLETNMVVGGYLEPWKACFGPGEALDMDQLRSGKKLPCFYAQNAHGSYDYWEENACDVLVRSNCYCYAVGRYVESYCEPGLGATGRPFQLPVRDCGAAIAGVVADGGRQVDRAAVYSLKQSAPGSHFIALAVKPSEAAGDTGDFHFWRFEADGTWSYKAGDTLSRNTYRNGTALRDVEPPEARGQYRQFCGYFEVWPSTHRLVGNSYYFSNLPARFKLWRDAAVRGQVKALEAISPGWLAAYRSYYADAGWEDGLYRPKESLRLPAPRVAAGAGGGGGAAGHPHTYSVRPMGWGGEGGGPQRRRRQRRRL